MHLQCIEQQTVSTGSSRLKLRRMHNGLLVHSHYSVQMPFTADSWTVHWNTSQQLQQINNVESQ